MGIKGNSKRVSAFGIDCNEIGGSGIGVVTGWYWMEFVIGLVYSECNILYS